MIMKMIYSSLSEEEKWMQSEVKNYSQLENIKSQTEVRSTINEWKYTLEGWLVSRLNDTEEWMSQLKTE